MDLRRRWWLGLTLWFFAAGAHAQVCPQSIELATPTNRLILLEQPGVDIKVLDPSSGRMSRGPAMNYGVEVVLSRASDQVLRLCPQPVFASISELPAVAHRIIELRSEDDLKLGEKLFAGYQLWHESTESSREAAILNFLAFAEGAAGSENPALQALSPLAMYLAAEGNRQSFQYHKVEPLLAEVSTPDSSYLDYAVNRTSAYLIAFNPGRRQEAVRLLDKVIEVAKEHYPADLAEHYANKSLPFLLAGDLEMGGELLRLGEAASMGQPINLARVYNNLGWLSKLRGDREQSIEMKARWYQQSIAEHELAALKAREAGDVSLLSRVLNNKGTIHSRIGDGYGAVEAFRDALSVIDGVGSQESQTSALANLATAYVGLGDYKKALEYFDLVYERYAEADKRFAALASCNRGRAYREIGEYELSLESYMACEKIRGKRHLQANIGLGRTYIALQDWQKAHFHLTIARDIMASSNNTASLDRFNDDANIARTSANEALVLAHLGDIDRSREVAREAEAIIGIVLSPRLKLEVYRPLMRTYLALGQPEKSIELGYAAIELIEQVYAGLEPERVGPAWSARSSDIYTLLIELVVEQGQVDPVGLLQLVERSRATNLRLRLNAHSLGMTESYAMTRDTRLAKMSELANRRALAPEQATFEQFYLQELFYSENPLRMQEIVAPPEISEIQSALKPGQLAIVYQQVGERLERFILSYTGLSHDTLVTESDLNDQAMAFTNSIKQRKPDWRERAAPLAMLLDGVEWQGVTNVVITAQDQLEHLPWQALLVASGVPRGVSAITAPSLSVLTTASTLSASGPKPRISILANPVLDYLESDEAALWSSTLQPLPWSEREAAAIQTSLSEGQVKIYLADEATRTALFSPEVRNSDILHIATHGFYSSDDQDNVGFVLTAEDGAGSGSFITLSDLYANRFNNRLVVVSGCETGIGQQYKGEGANSLARAFMAQGAENVISTYWKVSDRASASFMKFLYEELIEQQDIAAAFSEAQHRLRRDARFRHPYYWAAYNLHARGLEFSLGF